MEGSESNVAKLKVSTMKNMLDLLECPICMEAMYPPIYQCTNGHTLCLECKTKVTRCPSCQAQTLDIRALSLEKLIECFEYPCKYHIMGCKETHEITLKRQHEEHCKFRPYSCPYSEECNFKGNIPTLMLHLKDVHCSNIYNLTISKHVDNPTSPGSKSAVYDYFGNHFFLSLEKVCFESNNHDYLVSMAFMGEYDEGKGFRCKLEIGNEENKLSWEGVPLSIRQGRKELNEFLVGLIIPNQLIFRFLRDSFFYNDSSRSFYSQKCFRVKGFIWKKESVIVSKHEFDFWPHVQGQTAPVVYPIRR